jgi:hypothetical protein
MSNKQTKNKAGRKPLAYKTKSLTVRLDTRLIDRMNEDKVDKTKLIHQLLRAHYNVQE